LDKNLELISRRLTPPLLSDDLADGDVIKYDSASDSWTAAAGGTGTLSFTAKNASGGTMTVGQTVYISGNSGEVPEVDLARADSESTMPASGIISVGGNNNATVTVVSYGELSGIALPNPPYIVGEPVYVSSTVAGGIQSTVPATEANLIQNIGIVVREHPSNGRIMVGGAGRTNAVPNLNSGNIFVGNASNQADDVSVSGDVTLSNTGVVTAAATQTNITSIPNLATVGTIGTGTWQATDIGVEHGGTGVSSFTDAGVLIGNGTGAVQATSAGTSGQVLTSNGPGVDPTFQNAAGGSFDVQTFTSSGTWTKPSGATMVMVEVIGGGGGGASGRKGASGTDRRAGGGGGCSGVTYNIFAASQLSSTETVTIGAGGTGGASVTTNSTNGNGSTDGGTSIFGSTALATCVGGKGISTYYSAGGGSAAFSSTPGYTWGQWGAVGGNGSSSTNGASGVKTGSGGAGGRIDTGDTEYSGGDGGAPNVDYINYNMTGIIALSGGSGGAVGVNGSNATAGSGGGGGGGGANHTGDAGSGGNGASPGGGGGGGGATTDSAGNSGAGGNGGDGRVRVWTW